MIFVLAIVGIPYLALLALTAIEGRGQSPNLSHRGIEVGIKACILGLGVSGALFGSHEVRVKMGDVTAVIAIVVVFVDVTIAGLCLHLRAQSTKFTEVARASVSIFLGVLILALNVGIAWRYQ
jgi:tellurite resistance protein TehA-like permease